MCARLGGLDIEGLESRAWLVSMKTRRWLTGPLTAPSPSAFWLQQGNIAVNPVVSPFLLDGQSRKNGFSLRFWTSHDSDAQSAEWDFDL